MENAAHPSKGPHMFFSNAIPSPQPMQIEPRPLKVRYKLSKSSPHRHPSHHQLALQPFYHSQTHRPIHNDKTKRMHFLPTAFMAAASLVAATSVVEKPGLAIRSDLMSCEETYGGGWTPCGDEVSAHTPQLMKMSTMRTRG